MDISKLPDTAFVCIFDHLPWEQCISVGRVSKSFRRISLLVTSRTTCLDLTEDRFRNLTSDQLLWLLDLCSQNLERIKFPGTDYGAACAAILSSYECPRLVELDLGYAAIGNYIFGTLIQNNRGLKSVIWKSDLNEDFDDPEFTKFIKYPDFISENLRSLELRCCNDDTLRSLTNRCPNLERLDIITKDITIDVFDQFIASIPQVQQIKIYLVENDIAFEDLINIWNCPLTSLEMIYHGGTVCANDEVLFKVSTCLPRLKKLYLWLTQATNEAVWSLGNLRDLESLELTLPSGDFDAGIRGLAHCGRLREVEMPRSLLSSFTLISLLRGCPQLRWVVIQDIHDVESGEEAALVLRGLSGMPKRDVTVGFHEMDDEEKAYSKSIWEAEAVADVLRELKEKEGIEIKFDWINWQFE